MSEILLNKLYLGDMYDAVNDEFLHEKKIKCIICVAGRLTITNKDPDIKIIHYPINDDHHTDIGQYFNEIGQIIDDSHCVLVNCAAGMSRSATIVIAYLMKYYNMDLKSALTMTRLKRPKICPNKHFMTILWNFEYKLFNKNSMTLNECSKLIYYN